MPFEPPDPRPGDPLSASLISQFFREVARLGRFSIAPPLEIQQDEAGIRLSLGLWMPIWIKLTSAAGTGGKYAWAQQIAVTGGTWAVHPSGRTGTTSVDPAYETNLNNSITLSPNPVVRAWRDPMSLNLHFQAGPC